MGPEEYDSQLPASDDDLQSSPPAGQPAASKEKGNDDPISDPNVPGQETQQDSLRSRVEDTQFEQLEPETQVAYDEPGLMSPKVSMAPQTANTGASEPPPILPFVTGIERPRGLELDDGDAPGFRFGKAPKHADPAQYSRSLGKRNDANPNPRSKTNVPDLVETIHAPHTASNVDHASPALSKAHSKEAIYSEEEVGVPLEKANSRSTTTVGNISKPDVVAPTPLEAHQSTLPPAPKTNIVNSSSAHTRIPAADTIQKSNTQSNIHPLPGLSPPAKSTRKEVREHHQQVPRNVGAKETSTHTSAPLFNVSAKEPRPDHRPSVAYPSVPKPLNKSHKPRPMKQPFPEVSPPRSKNSPGLHRHRTSRPLRPADANLAAIPPATGRHQMESHKAGAFADQGNLNLTYQTDATTRRESMTAHTSDQGQAAVTHNSINGTESSRLPTDVVLDFPPHNQRRDDQTREFSAPESDFTFHNRHVDEHSVPTGDSHGYPGDAGLHETQINKTDHRQFSFQQPCRSQTRPQSAASNTSKLRRPLGAADLLPQGVSESAILSINQPMRVQKTTRTPTPTRPVVRPDQNSLVAVSTFYDFVQNIPALDKILQEHKDQKAVLESQQAEIKRLNISSIKSNQDVQRLEEEKVVLNTKIKKFAEISARYKAHMNDVVQAQKHLMDEQNIIKTQSVQIGKETKAILKVHAERENHESRLRSMIAGAKKLGPCIEKMHQIEEDNVKYKKDTENAQRTNALLQSDLNARVLDLGRERHQTEQLQKSLNAQNETYRELVEALKKAQTTTVDELTKEGSLLARIFSSENLMQTKIDELSSFLNTGNSREPELPPTLIKLIEDLYTRIETKLKASENQDSSLNESSLRFFEDLKERVNQLRLDDDTKAGLNERISELRESNAALTASEGAHEVECQAMAKRIDEVGRELSSCKDQLTAKSDELATLLALPKEDPILLAKIHDLENTKTKLEGQINTINQESAKTKEELVLYRETAHTAQEELQRSEAKFGDTQVLLRNYAEDRKKYLATHKADIDKACQDVAKKAQAAKIEAKLQHDSMAKNLEQRRSEAEKELTVAQDQLQKSQEEKSRLSSSLNELQEEMSLCKKQMSQQTAFIKHANEIGQRLPVREEFDGREIILQQALVNISELRTRFDAVQRATVQKVDQVVSSHQQETHELTKKVDILQREKATLEEEKLEIQKKYEILKVNAERVSTQSGVRLEVASVDEWTLNPVHTPTLQVTPNLQRTASDINLSSIQRQQASPAVRTTTSVNRLVNKSSSPHQGTPKQLRPANRKASGLGQAVFTQELTTIPTHGMQVSAKGSVTSKVGEVSRAAQVPQSSARPSGLSSRRGSSIISQPPPAEKTTPSAHPVLTKQQAMITPRPTVATPNSEGACPSSDILSDHNSSEFGSVDQLGYDEEELHKTHFKLNYPGTEKAGKKETTGAHPSVSRVSRRDDAKVGVKFNDTPTSFHYPEDNEVSEASNHNTIPPHRLSTTDESARRRSDMPLKSALKVTRKAPDTIRRHDAINMVQIPMSTPTEPELPKTASHSTINKTKASGRRGSTGTSIFGTVAGSKPGSSSQATTLPLAAQKLPVEPINNPGEKSPLKRAPRNPLKRRNEDMSEPLKRLKKPRMNPFSPFGQARKESRSVIPDSQESVRGV